MPSVSGRVKQYGPSGISAKYDIMQMMPILFSSISSSFCHSANKQEQDSQVWVSMVTGDLWLQFLLKGVGNGESITLRLTLQCIMAWYRTRNLIAWRPLP